MSALCVPCQLWRASLKVPNNANAEAVRSNVAGGPNAFDLSGRSPAAQIFPTSEVEFLIFKNMAASMITTGE